MPGQIADPANAELHNVLAQSCLSAKNYDCAMKEYSWILQRTPDSAASHILMGEALDGSGKTPEAVAEFIRAEVKRLTELVRMANIVVQ